MKKNQLTPLLIVLVCICGITYFNQQVRASLSNSRQSEDNSQTLAPYVTSEMCTPEYWIQRQKKAYKILMDDQKIKEQNGNIKNTPETKMYLLEELEETFDGQAIVDSMVSFTSPSDTYIDGKLVPETYYKAIRKSIQEAKVSTKMPLRYGVVVNHTVMKAYPYAEFLSDSKDDVEWDVFINTAVPVNEPLVVYILTGDEKYAYVKNGFYDGWIPVEDIAIFKDKQEWESTFKMDDFLVVTGEKIYLEASASDKDLSEKKLAMGTVLPLELNYSDSVTSRMPWNNYVVKLPTRAADGSFVQKLALITANRDVSVGYLPLTQENIIRQAFKFLGNRYGLGGMLDSPDCSQFVREIYLCFGLAIPRDTSQQYEMPAKKYDFSLLTEKEKAAVLDSLPTGAIVQFPGHEMLYLGKVGTRYYTINTLSTLVNPLDEEA